MVRDLDLIENVDCLFYKKVIFYGAYNTGEKIYLAYKNSGISIYGFSDGDSQKWDTMYLGLPVLSHKALAELDSRNEIVIIITSYYVEEIVKELEGKGIAVNATYSVTGLELAVDKHIGNGLFDADFVSTYIKKKKLRKELWRLSGNRYNEFLSSISWQIIKDIYRYGNPIWSFTAGKVASQSLHYYLLERGFRSIHVHSVQSFFLNEGVSEEMKENIQEQLFISEPVKIVTGIREPVARDISLFFELLDDGFWWVEDEQEKKSLKKRCLEFCYAMIGKHSVSSHKSYNYNWAHYWNEHAQYGAMFDWFDLELKETFGMDVFQYKFDKEKGYSVIKKDNVELFLFRMDVLDSLNEPLGEFLKIDNFCLPQYNVGGNKGYKYIYQQMIKEIQLPEEYLDFYYHNNERMDFFYTEDQKEQMLKQWIL